MSFSTTDGKDYYIPDTCPYCNLSTGGQHESDCPMAKIKTFNSTMSEAEPGIVRFPDNSYRQYLR